MAVKLVLSLYHSGKVGRVLVVNEPDVVELLDEFPTFQKQLKPDGSLSLTVTDLTKIVGRYVPMGYTIYVEQVR